MTIAFRVLNKAWTLKCMRQKKYDAKKGRANSVAITYVHKRRIYLSPRGRDRETIVHELCHAYLSEMCVHSADLTAHDVEEFFAELFSKRGKELLSLADRLHAKVKEGV